MQRSNKWDAPRDVLLLGKRLETLADYKRESRSYNKQGTDYWNVYIHESRAKRAKICIEVPDDDSVSGDIRISDMTVEEIKVQLQGDNNSFKILEKVTRIVIKYSKTGANSNHISLNTSHYPVNRPYSKMASILTFFSSYSN